MLVWKITTINEDSGETLRPGKWEPVPAEAQDGGAYRLLSREYGRSTGKLADAANGKRAYGWKLHQVRMDGGRRFNHVALAVLGWKQDDKHILAYDVVRGRPLPGTDANKIKYVTPPTQYPGNAERWERVRQTARSAPADTSPSRVPIVRDILVEVIKINLEQARGERSAKSAAEALERLLGQIEAA